MILALCVALLAPAFTNDAVLRDLKGGERAVYEHHDVNRLLARFTPEALWVYGRQASPDSHDVRLDLKTIRRMLRLEWAGPPSGARLEFSEAEVDLKASPPRATFVEVQTGMGRRQLLKVRYTLRRTASGWQVVERRQWPLEDRAGPIPVLYNDAYWLDADALVDQIGTDTAAERLDALVSAFRFPELLVLTELLIRQPDPPLRAWTDRARAAWRLGQIDVARAAARAAQKHGADPGVPPALLATPR